jgi:hypothetical protein
MRSAMRQSKDCETVEREYSHSLYDHPQAGRASCQSPAEMSQVWTAWPWMRLSPAGWRPRPEKRMGDAMGERGGAFK